MWVVLHGHGRVHRQVRSGKLAANEKAKILEVSERVRQARELKAAQSSTRRVMSRRAHSAAATRASWQPSGLEVTSVVHDMIFKTRHTPDAS